jgi:hypothetical protein
MEDTRRCNWKRACDSACVTDHLEAIPVTVGLSLWLFVTIRPSVITDLYPPQVWWRSSNVRAKLAARKTNTSGGWLCQDVLIPA